VYNLTSEITHQTDIGDRDQESTDIHIHTAHRSREIIHSPVYNLARHGMHRLQGVLEKVHLTRCRDADEMDVSLCPFVPVRSAES
jgi:hypothetical protein